MLPPIDPAILQQNPRFQILYRNLKTSKLNEDGTTKDFGKLSLDVKKQLVNARIKAARTQLLLDALGRIAYRANELPVELQEVIQIVSAQLNGLVSLQEREILEDDVRYFMDYVEPVAETLSQHLVAIAIQIAKIANPEETSLDKLKNSIARLPAAVSAKKQENAVQTEALASQRLQITDLATQVLEAHRRILEASIRVLEQTIHGSVTRAVRAKAEHLAIVAKGMEMKLNILIRSQPQDSELVSALQSYNSYLRSEKGKLIRKENAAEEVLQRYQRAGPGMPDIAARYSRVSEEIKEVRKEIARLEMKD